MTVASDAYAPLATAHHQAETSSANSKHKMIARDAFLLLHQCCSAQSSIACSAPIATSCDFATLFLNRLVHKDQVPQKQSVMPSRSALTCRSATVQP